MVAAKKRVATQRTPGLWLVEDSPSGLQRVMAGRLGLPGFQVAEFNLDNGIGEASANASLCAAAPELLQALVSLVEFDGCYSGGDKMDAVDLKFNRHALRSQARAAIARARGES